MNRTAYGNLVESIDFMDPTRSHEVLPSRRFHERAAKRRAFAAVVWCVLGIAALVAACL